VKKISQNNTAKLSRSINKSHNTRFTENKLITFSGIQANGLRQKMDSTATFAPKNGMHTQVLFE
jgi:1-aminocyclopropane-1-carboxylate deaminase/D-cysteine desulfhydrase-like pyridoxal-dependent ACC family enzyme